MLRIPGGIGLALTVAACGGGTQPATTASPAAARSVMPTPTHATSLPTQLHTQTAQPTHSAATHTPSHLAIRHCHGGGLRAELNVQRSGMAALTLTNTSGSLCRMRGWARAAFLGADNSPLPVPVADVSEPGPPVEIRLDPGETAFAGLRWSRCDKAAADCMVATAVRISPPGHDGSTLATLVREDGDASRAFELPLKRAEIGTLQPAAEGITAW